MRVSGGVLRQILESVKVKLRGLRRYARVVQAPQAHYRLQNRHRSGWRLEQTRKEPWTGPMQFAWEHLWSAGSGQMLIGKGFS